MEDAENTLPPSKKKTAGRQLSRDNPGLDDEEESPEQETGTFMRASDEVLASRKIVKVHRHQTSSAPSAPSSNPFAGIRLTPPAASNATPVEITAEAGDKTVSEDVEGKHYVNKESENEKDEHDKQVESKVDEVGSESIADEKKTVNGTAKHVSAVEKAEVDKKENEDRKDKNNKNVEKNAEADSFSSFKQLSSSQNAFTGLVGTGFSSSTFSFGSIPKVESPLGSGSLFGLNTDQPSFSFGLSSNENSSCVGSQGASIVNKSEGRLLPSMQVVPVETGEENEEAVFTADSMLFEFLDGGWKERGKGELKLNVSKSGIGKARLVMRAKGNFRLILNASLYPDMKLTNMDKKGITFACVNSTGEGKDGLSTFALKFKDATIVEQFCVAVTVHKGKTTIAVETPENSPKASED